MKILAFSDLHCDLETAASLVEKSAEADVVIGAGDFARVHEGLDETIAALGAIDTPTLLVPGNNETFDALCEAAGEWEAATVLHGDATRVGEVTFFGLGGGIPVTPWDWSFDLSEEEAEAALEAMPEGAVLVVHSPPKGHVDGGLGSTAILGAIEAKSPPIAVCGHIHECWGQESQAGGTRVVNLGPSGTVIDIP